MAVSIIKNGLCGFSIRIGSCQTCEISKRRKNIEKKDRQKRLPLMFWQFWFTSKVAERRNNKL